MPLFPGVCMTKQKAIKMKKAADRKPFSERSTLIIGFVLLAVSIVLTYVWYQL